MNVNDALSELRVIKAQLVRSERVICYRWATIGISGIIGVLACFLQNKWNTRLGYSSTLGFIEFWSCIAIINVLLILSTSILYCDREELDA